MQETKRGTRAIIPSSSGKTIISKQTHQTRHTNSSNIFMHTSKRPRHQRLQKLTKVMQYLRNTKSLTLMIEPRDEPKWWVDSSYAIHQDMRSHTGIYMTLGKGAPCTASCKHKLNTKNSTETESGCG